MIANDNPIIPTRLTKNQLGGRDGRGASTIRQRLTSRGDTALRTPADLPLLAGYQHVHTLRPPHQPSTTRPSDTPQALRRHQDQLRYSPARRPKAAAGGNLGNPRSPAARLGRQTRQGLQHHRRTPRVRPAHRRNWRSLHRLAQTPRRLRRRTRRHRHLPHGPRRNERHRPRRRSNPQDHQERPSPDAALPDLPTCLG